MFLTIILLLSFLHGYSTFYLGKTNFGRRLLQMNYKYSKEYYQFYAKYKEPLLQSPIDYDSFAKENEKSYFLFEKNKIKIDDTNALLVLQNSTFRLDINQFADEVDFDTIETQDIMFNKIVPPRVSKKNFKKIIKNPIDYLTESLDSKFGAFSWNETDYLSPVKNQGKCGSCWAFSTTSALETFMRKGNFTIERLSEQELVDCSKTNHGCNGGIMHKAMDYIIERKGLASEQEYPYNATQSMCKLNTTRALGSNMTEYMFTIPESIVDLKYSVQQNPVAIAIDANNLFFRFYKDGVIDVPRNVSRDLNHAVLLVGYDHDEKGMYWIIQNSWGEQWGDNGFCKVRVKDKEGVLLSHLYGVYPSK